MKKRIVVILTLIVGGLMASTSRAKMFFVTGGPVIAPMAISTPAWVDANQVTGLLYSGELLLGDTLVVTARQTDPNYVGEWKLVGNDPDVTIDVGVVNEASIAFAPTVEGVRYVKYKSRISQPYKGRVRINTMAFRTRQEPPFSVEWFQITIPPVGEGPVIPW